MCGIAGFTRPGRNATEIIHGMVAAFRHRGPDAQGSFCDERLAFGHARLAVIDVAGGAQPRVDGATGDALVFNGEIYGYQDLARPLRDAGTPLRDECDTEVLFWLIRQYGVAETLRKISGMFAFAYRDGASGAVWLARDRFGEKPLYYAVRNGALVFASEVAAFKAHPEFRPFALSPAAVDRYLTAEYMPGTETIVDGISKLAPGHFLRCGGGDVRIERYWAPPAIGCAAPTTEADCVEMLDREFNTAIGQMLVADVPVGLFLSGGLDSSLVTACAARHSTRLTAYTVRMTDSSYDESAFGVEVAQQYGVRHQIVDMSDQDFLDGLERIERRLDEPFADASLVPTYLLCRAARSELTVVLGGDGADELFGGYPNYVAQRFAPAMAALPSAVADGLRAILSQMPISGSYMSLSFKLQQLTQGLGHPVDLQSFLWMSAFSPREKKRLWKSDIASADCIESWMVDGAPASAVERLLHLMMLSYLPEDILMKMDRASMYNSLEVRSPFLHPAFAEKAIALPASMKIKGVSGKYILKELARRYLPDRIIDRKKHGFAPPLSRLLKGKLADKVQDVLLDRQHPLSTWFDQAAIEAYCREHRAGSKDHRKRLWTLYMLYRAASNLVGPAPAGAPGASVDVAGTAL